jgi:signal transduction histidine kinase
MDTYPQDIADRLDRLEEMMSRSFEMIDRRLSAIEESERNDIAAMAEEMRSALSAFRDKSENDLRYIFDRFEREWQNLGRTIEHVDTMVDRISDKVNS